MQPVREDAPLPWEEIEHPGRRFLGDMTAHYRRERALLFLSGVFVLAATLLPVLGIDRVVQLRLALPGWSGEAWLPVPIGAAGYPLAFVAAQLVCELYGRKLARSLVVIALVLQAGLLAALVGAGAVAGVETATAFLGAYLAAQLLALELFHRLRVWTDGRRLWLRGALSHALGQAAGAIALALLLHHHAGAARLAAHATVGYGYAAIGAVAGTLLLCAAASWLGTYLRIALSTDEASRRIVLTPETIPH